MNLSTRQLERLTRPLRWLRARRDGNGTDPTFPWTWTWVADDPDQVAPLTVYVVGEGKALWKAVLRCPCGCGALIELSLHRVGRPRWIAMLHLDGRVTLRPSVWRTTGCRSHFVLERGRVSYYGSGPQVESART